MIKRASKKSQVIVATQSTRLVDEFDLEQLVIVERDRHNGASTFKRILREISDYDKVTAGVSVVEYIGLAQLREKCSHFNDWITRLELK